MKNLCLLLLWFACVPCQANIDFSEVNALFDQRGEGVEKIHDARKLYEKSLLVSEGLELIYPVEHLAMLAYFEGELLNEQTIETVENRKRLYTECINYLDLISPSTMGIELEAYYYWQAKCLVLWSKAVGHDAAIEKFPLIMDLLERGIVDYASSLDGAFHQLGAEISINNIVFPEFYSPNVALKCIERAEELNSYNYLTYLLKAKILLKQQKTKEAKEFLQSKIADISDKQMMPGYEPELRIYLKQMYQLLNIL